MLKKIKEFTNMPEAKMAKEYLEKKGINAFIKADDCGSMRPAMNFTQGIELQVEENDIDKAKEVLKELE